MPRFHSTVIVLVLSILVISCSTPQQTADKSAPAPEEQDTFHPAWYSGNEFETTDSTFTAFGTAVGVSSDAASQKAVTKARANFEQYLSSRLESIRNEAIESGNEGLESQEFIFVLRSAEASVSEALSLMNKEVKQSEKFSSYHGFAAVTISREALITYLGNRLQSHQALWEGLRNSNAFNRL